MRIVQVNDNDLFGSRFNGYGLNEQLRAMGHSATQFVWTKHSESPHVVELATRNPQRQQVKVHANELHRDYATNAVFEPFSYELAFHRRFLDADIVNLHLVHNYFMSILHLPMLTRLKPTVWTLHDPWAMTGHCIHPFGCDRWKTGCGRCPLLDVAFAIEKDTTALNWEIKRQTYAQCDLDLIVASEWMLDRVKQSPLLERFRVHMVPFGVDCERFRPADKRAAKIALGIDPDTLVIAMRAIPGEFKGLDILKDSLRRLRTDRRITLLTFNYENLLDEFKKRFDIVELGWVHGDDEIVGAYNATDVFLMPSTAESFGMMAMESMACGVPSVVTEGTALPQTVLPELGGGVAVPHDADAVARALTQLITDDGLRATVGARARELAVERYNAERHARQTLEVYESVIDRRGRDERASVIIADLRAHAIDDRATRPPAEPEAAGDEGAPAGPVPGEDGAEEPAAEPPHEEEMAPPEPVVARPVGIAGPPEPDSLELLIKVHNRLRSSRKATAVWRRFVKPAVTRLIGGRRGG